MGHPKALLFIDNEQAQVLELDVLGQNPVGADYQVNTAVFQAGHDLLAFGLALETGEAGNFHREALKAVLDGLVVLLGQDGRGHQEGDLLAVTDGLKGCPHGYFGFPEADIPDQKPVHRLGLFHVSLDFRSSPQLVRGWLIRKGSFKGRLV